MIAWSEPNVAWQRWIKTTDTGTTAAIWEDPAANTANPQVSAVEEYADAADDEPEEEPAPPPSPYYDDRLPVTPDVRPDVLHPDIRAPPGKSLLLKKQPRAENKTVRPGGQNMPSEPKKLHWSNPSHPIWRYWMFTLVILFAAVRVAFAKEVDGDELRDILMVSGMLAPSLLTRNTTST